MDDDCLLLSDAEEFLQGPLTPDIVQDQQQMRTESPIFVPQGPTLPVGWPIQTSNPRGHAVSEMKKCFSGHHPLYNGGGLNNTQFAVMGIGLQKPHTTESVTIQMRDVVALIFKVINNKWEMTNVFTTMTSAESTIHVLIELLRRHNITQVYITDEKITTPIFNTFAMAAPDVFNYTFVDTSNLSREIPINIVCPWNFAHSYTEHLRHERSCGMCRALKITNTIFVSFGENLKSLIHIDNNGPAFGQYNYSDCTIIIRPPRREIRRPYRR
jgi:hypothetical protein